MHASLLGLAALVFLPALERPASAQMVHGTALPTSWTPTYNMSESTFLMACNASGPFNPAFAAKWGIADFDWSNWQSGSHFLEWDGKQYGPYSAMIPETCEENLVVQAAMTKAKNNRTKVFVYRNMVKALPWYKAVREKLVDEQYSGFFLHFNCNRSASDPKVLPGEGGCHVPRQGTDLYHDQEQTVHGRNCTNHTGHNPCCGVPCGEYVFDHRNGSMLRQWFIEEFVGGQNGIDSPYIDGVTSVFFYSHFCFYSTSFDGL
eukprot:SAG31_NODE_3812_length_3860_cov_1.918107_1_plen_261_part_00